MARSFRRTPILGHCASGSEKYDKRRCSRARRVLVRRTEELAVVDGDIDFPVFARDGSYQFQKDGKSWWGTRVTLVTWVRRPSRLHLTVQLRDSGHGLLVAALRK
jgi:hypothetical protein